MKMFAEFNNEQTFVNNNKKVYQELTKNLNCIVYASIYNIQAFPENIHNTNIQI